jgi:hypothetical protein
VTSGSGPWTALASQLLEHLGDEKDVVCVELDRSVAPKFTKDPTKKEQFSGKEIKDSGALVIPSTSGATPSIRRVGWSPEHAGEIQILRATYELLKDELDCRRRGTIEVKGNGRMETWYLVGPRRDDF